MTVSQIAILIALFGGMLFWYRLREMRRYALSLVRRYCDQHQIQLLNDTVSFKRLWLMTQPRLLIGRCYEFEFTADTLHRHKGWLYLQGLKVDRIETETYFLPSRLPDEPVH